MRISAISFCLFFASKEWHANLARALRTGNEWRSVTKKREGGETAKNNLILIFTKTLKNTKIKILIMCLPCP